MIPILQANSVSKSNEEQRSLLSSISFEVQERERLAIVGETGSGKSTLLKSIGGLAEIDQGEVMFRGSKVEGPEEKLVAGHAQISYLSQHFELPKFITVEDFLTRKETVRVEDPAQIYGACRVQHLLDRDTRALSGGEKQRVALTKELLKAPEVLLLDEPFSNLDFSHKRIIREVLEEIEHDLEITVILVAHDPKDVLSWADRVMVLRKGKIVQFDRPESVFDRPVDEYVASLFGAYSLLASEVENGKVSGRFHSIAGRIFLRPRDVTLGDTKKGLQGHVKKVRYYGAYDELLIQSAFGDLIVNSTVGLYQEGQELTFSFNK